MDAAARLITVMALSLIIQPIAADAAYRWTGAERVVAMSDPHGAYDSMARTLSNAGVVSADGGWAGGQTTLVITGDLLDRGEDSRKIMDLVMRLEEEAATAGGRVLLTLGNHEVMNLVGDLRYVARGEYAAFAGEEPMEERERWFQRLLTARQAVDELVDEVALRAEFDRDRPPGFYAHRAAFSSNGKYGRWLLAKPLMVVVNETAYVHGGMPPVVAELGLDKLNQQLGAQVTNYVEALEVLYGNGVIDPAVNFYDHARYLEALPPDPERPTEIQSAMDVVIQLNDATVHDSGSPLWYRGTVGCSILTEGDVLAGALEAVGATRVVIGHTPTVTRRVLERFDGRVIEIDTGMLNAAYRGSGFALVLEGEHVAVAQEHTTELTAPVRHPRRVGERADDLDSDTLADILASGTIASTSEDEIGRTIVRIEHGGSTVAALFSRSPRRQNPELAAYRIDRMLALDIVPVTVVREVDGKTGTLQFLPNNARDEAWRSSAGQGGGAWCPLQRQWNSMYIFDALIYNQGRMPTSMVYSTGNWHLMSMGHGQAFDTSRGRPAFLESVPLELTSTWVDALKQLIEDELRESLEDLLSNRHIGALLARRDALLDGER